MLVLFGLFVLFSLGYERGIPAKTEVYDGGMVHSYTPTNQPKTFDYLRQQSSTPPLPQHQSLFPFHQSSPRFKSTTGYDSPRPVPRKVIDKDAAKQLPQRQPTMFEKEKTLNLQYQGKQQGGIGGGAGGKVDIHSTAAMYDFKGFQPKTLPITIGFQSLGLTVLGNKRVLKNVTGVFEHSKLISIMGPSGQSIVK